MKLARSGSIQDEIWSKPLSAWQDFWFMPAEPEVIGRFRIAICLFVALWLLSFFASADEWFGTAGLLSSSMASVMIDFEETPRWQHWSPLWWSDSVLMVRIWLVLGTVLSVLAAIGLGGRLVLLLLWLMCIAWIHRIAWLQGPVEPALVAMLGYVMVAPGRKLGEKQEQPVLHWSNCVALRLIQTHWWILMAAGLLMQLSGLVWWRGDAAWWLAAQGRSRVLSVEILRNQPMLINGLTHAMILVQILSLWLILVPAARWLGVFFAILALLMLGLMANQFLYALLLGSGLLVWLPARNAASSDTQL